MLTDSGVLVEGTKVQPVALIDCGRQPYTYQFHHGIDIVKPYNITSNTRWVYIPPVEEYDDADQSSTRERYSSPTSLTPMTNPLEGGVKQDFLIFDTIKTTSLC